MTPNQYWTSGAISFSELVPQRKDISNRLLSCGPASGMTNNIYLFIYLVIWNDVIARPPVTPCHQV